VRFACLILLLTACAEPRRTNGLSLWLEELPAERQAEAFAFAGRNGLGLNVAMNEALHGRAELRQICVLADRYEVPLKLWPLLAKEDGYWANQQNMAQFTAWTRKLIDWAQEDCETLDGVVIDLELSWQRVEALAERRNNGENAAAAALSLLNGRDLTQFEEARASLQRTARYAHDRNLRFIATTLAMLVDDQEDGDDSVAKALGTPILGIDWDFISFQVYRSLFDQQFPDKEPYSSGLVSSYAASIAAHFPGRAGIDLGSTGGGIGLTAGLPDAQALQDDISAALAAGITIDRIQVFSLEGLFDKPDADAWVRSPQPQSFTASDADTALRALVAFLDQLSED
jgi:hypothetical protein